MPVTYPDIDDTLNYDDRYDLLSDKVLTDCQVWQVESGFNCYIEEEIGDKQKHSWKAVWKSHQFSYDVLVEVFVTFSQKTRPDKFARTLREIQAK